jgi:uncharacterized protein YbjT (DUF2867 family)
MPRIVLLLGATGLVGGKILEQLVRDDDVHEIRVIVRRSMANARIAPKVRELVTDFEALERHVGWLGVDQIFCALGTTLRKAGSRQAFRRVDLDYPMIVARHAHRQGARQFLLVSSMGADAGSRIFYTRVKGELEDAVRAVGFHAVTIARPSFLAGRREESRIGEAVVTRLAHLLPGAMKPVRAGQVASALVRAARIERPGVEILDNTSLRLEREDLA